jgi:hypothetical protein
VLEFGIDEAGSSGGLPASPSRELLDARRKLKMERGQSRRLILSWALPVIPLLLALFGTANVAKAAEGSQIMLCVNRSGLTRMAGPNERCRPSEKLVKWDLSGSHDDSGSQGGALTVIDSTGKTVGPLIRPDAVVITVNGDRLLIGVRPDGFFGTISTTGLTFYRTGTNCSGGRYVEPSTGLFFAHLRLLGSTGYYGGWTSTPTSVASVEFSCTATGCQCTSFSGTFNLTPVKTVELNPLFTPPFSIK